MMSPATALQHWGSWAVDNGCWRLSCYSMESHYLGLRHRFLHDDDMEKARRFRYDQHIGETVEALVNTLPGHERRVLRARYVTWPHLTDELIARRLGLPARNLDTLLLAAHLHFGQHWLQWQQGAA
jgi:hypothetical protein